MIRWEVVREAARTDAPTEIKESKESEIQQQRPSQISQVLHNELLPLPGQKV